MPQLPFPPNLRAPGFPRLHPALPPGAIIAFAGPLYPQGPPPNSSSAPWFETLGWMVCDGRTLKVAQYPLLFFVLGNQYGGNINDDTFQIPNLQGQFLRGVAANTQQDPDLEKRTPADPGDQDPVGSTQSFAMQDHVHQYQGAQQGSPGGDGSPVGTVLQTTTGSPVLPNSPTTAAQVSSETRPTNIYVYYLIKFV